ncbi:MAG: hypothetical protein ABFC38_07455 [Methanospirillum sp.]
MVATTSPASGTASCGGAGRNVPIETCSVRPGTWDNNLNFVFRDAKTLHAPVEYVRANFYPI